MKEEDAAILERGVGDSCSSGRTPVLVPIRPPSTDDLPAMMSLSLPSNSGESSSTTKHANNAPLGGAERDAGSTIEGSSCCSQTVGDEHPTDSLFSRRISGFGDCSDLPSAPKDEGNKTQSGETTTTTTTTPAPTTPQANDNNNNNNNHTSTTDNHNKNSTTPCLMTVKEYRRCLSGEVRCVGGGESELCDEDSHTVDSRHRGKPSGKAPPLRTVKETRSSRRSETAPKGGLTVRSMSFDRRLNEAVQFAEAVGELPPTSQSEVQDIIEESGSEYDDDTDEEVHVDKRQLSRGDSRGDGHPNSSAGSRTDENGQDDHDHSYSESSNSHHRRHAHDITEGRVDGRVHSEGEPTASTEFGQRMVSQNGTSGMGTTEVARTEPTHQHPHGQEGSIAEHQSRQKTKARPRWPFQTPGVSASLSSSPFAHKLPAEMEPPEFVYKGISSNPPEITKRGISRGNYAQLHRKAWLEVSDKYHRYGKNLRLYYRYWERLGFPTNQFFDWLDSKGEAAGQPLPNLDDCPRSQLDADTVLYITNPDITQSYVLDIIADEKGRGLVVDVDGDPVKTSADGWIFVLRDKRLYGAKKVTSVKGHSKQRFHHSSFFGGKAVAAAGIILTDDDGYLSRFYPHSGHYRPGEADVQRMLFYLHHKGVDMETLEVDTQQFLHVTRSEVQSKAGQVSDEGAEKKKKKTESLHLMPAVDVASLLAHKARNIEQGVFGQLHSLRRADVTTVREALETVDNGGYWKNLCRRYRGSACCPTTPSKTTSNSVSCQDDTGSNQKA